MACAVAATFFLRYWRMSGDRLFAFFATAFAAMALEWLGQALLDLSLPGSQYVYLVRCFAFVLIIIGIADKNRREHRP
jgi:hypothetical protein